MLLFSVLYGFWAANYIAFNGDAMRELASRFLELAEKQAAKVPIMIGHRLMGCSQVLTGNASEGREHFDQALALYDPVEHRPVATRFGQDARVSTLSYRSLTLWLLGYPEAALADTHYALEEARGIGQAAGLMYALLHASLTHLLCGNYAKANAEAGELTALADEKASSFWKAQGTSMQGFSLALAGKALSAVHIITSGLTAFRSTGAASWTSLQSSHLALAYMDLGQFDDAWRCVGEAQTALQTTNERWYEAEVNRITGELALQSPERDAAKAQACFEHALSVARQQQAKSCELRAAMSMARLWRDQGKREGAHELLAPVYGWFTEGFDTLDLKEAKALLERLAS